MDYIRKVFFSRSENFNSTLNKALKVGLFVSSFLIVFQPFGIFYYQSDFKYLLLLGFGIISFIVILLFEAIGLNSYKLNINIFRERIPVNYFQILVIALLNYAYAASVGMVSFGLNSIFLFLLFTASVATFVVAFKFLIEKIKRPKEMTNTRVELISEIKSESFFIEIEKLLYITSSDNYCELNYIEFGENKKKLIRASLKSLAQQLKVYHVFRSHRSYIVNLEKIRCFNGSFSKGYRLELIDGTIIPVSKSYLDNFKKYLSK